MGTLAAIMGSLVVIPLLIIIIKVLVWIGNWTVVILLYSKYLNIGVIKGND